MLGSSSRSPMFFLQRHPVCLLQSRPFFGRHIVLLFQLVEHPIEICARYENGWVFFPLVPLVHNREKARPQFFFACEVNDLTLVSACDFVKQFAVVHYALKLDPHPQVLLTFGFSNLKPLASSVSR